jgi:hypothetical protein
MEMKPITENAIAEPVGIVPAVLLRPILIVPRNNAPADPPLYAYVCPHNGVLQLVTEPITILPTVVEAKVVSKPPVSPMAGLFGLPEQSSDPVATVRATVLLRFGEELFVGAQLLRGHPDKLPEALGRLLTRYVGDDLKHGQRHKWLCSPPVRLPGGSYGI